MGGEALITMFKIEVSVRCGKCFIDEDVVLAGRLHLLIDDHMQYENLLFLSPPFAFPFIPKFTLEVKRCR